VFGAMYEKGYIYKGKSPSTGVPMTRPRWQKRRSNTPTTSVNPFMSSSPCATTGEAERHHGPRPDLFRHLDHDDLDPAGEPRHLSGPRLRLCADAGAGRRSLYRGGKAGRVGR
jgi:hypothetical protein